jgi:anthranilate phosphoribosyltransferase
MKHVAATRSALGIPTIFNLLGPLTNPGRARHQLLGVFAPELTDRIATVLRELGSHHAWVVHADDGLDELSTLGHTRISELKGGRVQTFTLDPRTLGFDYGRLSDLQVTTAEESAEMIRNILAAHKSPARDITVLNAAAALHIAGRADTLAQAVKLAEESIDSHCAAHTLATLVRLTNA